MPYNINITYTAEQDLRKIKCYIAEVLEAPYSAARIINFIHKSIEILVTFPETGAIAPEQNLARGRVRLLHVQKYRIYYGIDEKQKTVHIYAILHHLQDSSEINQKTHF